MKIVFFIGVFCLFAFSKGTGQTKFNTDKFKTGSLASQLKTIEKYYEDVKGSPYAELDFKEGYVSFDSGQIVDDLQLRYNIYSDQFEILGTDSVIYGFTPLVGVHWVGVNESKYIYHQYYVGNKLGSGYFRIELEGNISLLVKERRSYHFEEEAKAYIPAKPARFVEMPNDYYILRNSQLPIKFDNIGELIRVLSENNKKINDFVKSEKIRKATLENFARIVRYYNLLE